MPRAYINIGSNIGDREALVGRAVALIMERIDRQAIVSRPVWSDPWGFESDHRFLNAGVSVATDLTPLELLDLLQSVEREISPAPHRTPGGAYADRLIDIDLIAIDGVVMDHPRLTLPHPRAALRPFVMMPLIETLPPCATGAT